MTMAEADLSSEQPTVLLIEDNEVDREAIRRLLGKSWQILEASTASEGLEVFWRDRPEAVLLDHRLPDAEGVDLVPRLAQEGAAVIVLTGQGNEQVAVRAMKRGAQDYLVKGGLKRETLQRALEHAIETSSLRHKLEQERRKVRETEERFRAVFEAANVGILVADAYGTILQVNPFFARLLSYEPGELEGMDVLEITHAPDLDVARASLASRERKMVEQRYVASDGRVIWALVAPATVADDHGRPILRISVVLDVSERVRLEEQFRQAQKMEAFGRLAGGVAHDFNNVLTVVLSFGSFLAETLPAEDRRSKDVQEILSAARRAARLTEQLLAFSRRTPIEPRILQVEEVVRESERMLARLLGEDVQLIVEVEPNGWEVRADLSVLEQCVLNLAVNARDAMPEGGRLVVRTRNVRLVEPEPHFEGEAPPGEYVVLEVVDSGAGIAPEVLPYIFEPFFTTKGQERGTGLGLATCWGIVRQAGGFITVTSEIGVGTSFRIHLPRAVAVPEPESRVKTLPARGNETILLVEDDDQVRALARRALMRQGYQVREAADPAEAEALLGEPGEVDLLLSDVVMPGISGFELARRLRARVPSLRVLLMSGYTEDEVAQRGLEESRLPLLQKPFTPDSLAQRLREVLEA